MVILIATILGSQAPVYAQSSVTVYGFIDVAVQSVSGYSTGNINLGNTTPNKTIAMAQGSRNWLGFTGTQDLGQGLALTFKLEERFYPNNGQIEEKGVLFHGESTLGLTGSSLGSIKMGLALTPLWAQDWLYDPWYSSAYVGSIGAYQNGSFNDDPSGSLYYSNYGRVQDAIFYDSSDLSGFKVHAALQLDVPPCAGADCIAAQTPRRRVMGLTLTYADPLLNAMASYEVNNVGDTIWLVGSSYKLEKLTVMGTYAQVRLDALYNPIAPKEIDYTLAATYALDARNTLRTGFGLITHVAGTGSNYAGAPLGSNQHKFSIGNSYAISKRSNIYADLWRETTFDEPVSTGYAIGMNTAF